MIAKFSRTLTGLLLAVFIPGAFSAIIYGCLVVLLAKLRKNIGPPISGFTLKQRFYSAPYQLVIFHFEPLWRGRSQRSRTGRNIVHLPARSAVEMMVVLEIRAFVENRLPW